MDHYQMLGVGYDASSEEIERAFRQHAEHLKSDPLRLDRLLDAYVILNDKNKRTEYDLQSHVKRNRQKSTAFNRKFWKGKRNTTLSEEKKPTLSQLMDFDWNSVEEIPPDSPHQRKAFYDEILFKVLVVSAVLILVVLALWAIK